MTKVELVVNGQPVAIDAPARMTLADALRGQLRLTGTHLGCEQGVCGACTVLLNGEAVRSCLLFAVQASGCEVTTVEGLAEEDGTLSPLQDAFVRHRAFQCGFCTPGILMNFSDVLNGREKLSRHEVRELLSGHICRCTGYQPILDAVCDVLSQSGKLADEDAPKMRGL